MERGRPATPEGLLDAARIEYSASSVDLEAVPSSGAVLLAVDGPFGIIEGLVLAALLPRVRMDVKVLANYVLAEVPGFESSFLPVDPWPGRRAVTMNRHSMLQAVTWLSDQKLLAVFPAGDCMALPLTHPRRPRWRNTPVRLARLSGAQIVPACFLRKEAPAELELRIGSPIPWQRLAAIGSDQTSTEYVHWHAAALKRRHESPERLVPRLAC